MDGLLSVVVPVYRVEPYLDRCVESIVNQTYSNLEIILVDDGSPDNCPKMCDDWAERDSRIRVIHKENGGLSDARNAGIALATGEFLAFVDSDDYIAGDMYEIMIAALRRTEAGIACCGTNIVKNGVVTPVHCLPQEQCFTGELALREVLLCGCVNESACDKVYRMEVFDEILYPVGEINEDIVVIPFLLDRAETIVHTGVPLYFYCRDGCSITRSSYSPKKRIMIAHLDALEHYLKANHPSLLPDLVVLQAGYCQSVLYLLLDNKAVYKTYQDDYQEFYRRFKQSFWSRNRLVKTGTAEKIKGYLIYFKLYYILHYFAQIRKRGKS